MSGIGGTFVDFVRIHVRAGDGGHGCISFARDKLNPFAGPDGGDGGRGGSIWLEADAELGTLVDFKTRPSIIAKRGAHGQGKNCSGKSGEDIVLYVPRGTIAVDSDTGEVLGDLTESGQRMLVAKGGDGGFGNAHYATPNNKAPRKALDGWPGEQHNLILELKVIADVGFVGLPNAGKSTLLAGLTDANPKIAAYPFTTLSPNLGVFMASNGNRRITLADIPGLIEGAHKGAGLGDRFLRHIERTRVLVHLVAPEAGEGADGALTLANADPEAILYAWRLVRDELRSYSAALLEKPSFTCLNKADVLDESEVEAIRKAFKEQEGVEIMTIAARDGIGLDALRARIEEIVLQADREDIRTEEE